MEDRIKALKEMEARIKALKDQLLAERYTEKRLICPHCDGLIREYRGYRGIYECQHALADAVLPLGYCRPLEGE